MNDVAATAVIIGVVVNPLIWVMRSHFTLNRDIGELTKDAR